MDQGEWSKYKCPPDMLTREKANSRLQLTANQLNDQMIMIIDQQLANAETPEEKQAWANMKAKTQVKKLHSNLKDAFVEDFVLWIDGRSPYNVVSRDEIKIDKDGNPTVKTVKYTPWGNKSMSFLPGAGEFIAGPIDNRDHVIKELTKLIATNPKNIEDLWYYYKFIVRKIGLDRSENVIKEQNFYNDYDYMEKNPLKVGEGPVYDDQRNIVGVQPELVNDPRYTLLTPNNPKPMPFDPDKYTLMKDAVFNEARTGIVNIIDTPEFSGLGAEDKIYMLQVARYFSKVRKDQVEKDKELELDILQKIDTMLPDADIDDLKNDYKNTYHMISQIQNKKKRKQVHKRLYDRTSVISKNRNIDLGIKQKVPKQKQNDNVVSAVQYYENMNKTIQKAAEEFDSSKAHPDNDTAFSGMNAAMVRIHDLRMEYSEYMDNLIGKLRRDGKTAPGTIKNLEVEKARNYAVLKNMYERYLDLDEEESERRANAEAATDSDDEEDPPFHDPYYDDIDDLFDDPVEPPQPTAAPVPATDSPPKAASLPGEIFFRAPALPPRPPNNMDSATPEEKEYIREMHKLETDGLNKLDLKKPVEYNMAHTRAARDATQFQYNTVVNQGKRLVAGGATPDAIQINHVTAQSIKHRLDTYNNNIIALKARQINEQEAEVQELLNKNIHNVLQAGQVKAKIETLLEYISKEKPENRIPTIEYMNSKIKELDYFIDRTTLKANIDFEPLVAMGKINTKIEELNSNLPLAERQKHREHYHEMSLKNATVINLAQQEGKLPKSLENTFMDEMEQLGEAMDVYRKKLVAVENEIAAREEAERAQEDVRLVEEMDAMEAEFKSEVKFDAKAEKEEIVARLKETNGITSYAEVEDELKHAADTIDNSYKVLRELKSAGMPDELKDRLTEEIETLQFQMGMYQEALLQRHGELEAEAKAKADRKTLKRAEIQRARLQETARLEAEEEARRVEQEAELAVQEEEKARRIAQEVAAKKQEDDERYEAAREEQRIKNKIDEIKQQDAEANKVPVADQAIQDEDNKPKDDNSIVDEFIKAYELNVDTKIQNIADWAAGLSEAKNAEDIEVFIKHFNVNLEVLNKAKTALDTMNLDPETHAKLSNDITAIRDAMGQYRTEIDTKHRDIVTQENYKRIEMEVKAENEARENARKERERVVQENYKRLEKEATNDREIAEFKKKHKLNTDDFIRGMRSSTDLLKQTSSVPNLEQYKNYHSDIVKIINGSIDELKNTNADAYIVGKINEDITKLKAELETYATAIRHREAELVAAEADKKKAQALRYEKYATNERRRNEKRAEAKKAQEESKSDIQKNIEDKLNSERQQDKNEKERYEKALAKRQEEVRIMDAEAEARRIKQEKKGKTKKVSDPVEEQFARGVAKISEKFLEPDDPEAIRREAREIRKREGINRLLERQRLEEEAARSKLPPPKITRMPTMAEVNRGTAAGNKKYNAKVDKYLDDMEAFTKSRSASLKPIAIPGEIEGPKTLVAPPPISIKLNLNPPNTRTGLLFGNKNQSNITTTSNISKIKDKSVRGKILSEIDLGPITNPATIRHGEEPVKAKERVAKKAKEFEAHLAATKAAAGNPDVAKVIRKKSFSILGDIMAEGTVELGDPLDKPIPIERPISRRSEADKFPTEEEVTSRLSKNDRNMVQNTMKDYYSRFNQIFPWSSGSALTNIPENKWEDSKVTNRKLHVLSDELRKESDAIYRKLKQHQTDSMLKYYYEVGTLHRKVSDQIKSLHSIWPRLKSQF